MERYRLDQTIENLTLEIRMTMSQINEKRDSLRQSLKIRKELGQKTNETTYQEAIIEQIYDENMFDESNATIADLTEKNNGLTEQVKSLRRELDLQSTRMCELMEQKRKDGRIRK